MAQARAMQAFPYNTPSHTRSHDGRGTGGRRLWHFMKREALSGIPLVLCASVCLCVREKYRRKEWAREKHPSWLFLCLNMVWKTKRGQGGVTDHSPSHAPVPVSYNGRTIIFVMRAEYACKMSLAQISQMSSYCKLYYSVTTVKRVGKAHWE